VCIRTGRCEEEGREFVRLSIENDGATVDASIVAQVFEPFFTTKTSGTGLGLTIVRRTVEAHSGQVAIRPRDGGGTVLTIVLPVRPPGARETPRSGGAGA
jgi:signal transduction histidine kinase